MALRGVTKQPVAYVPEIERTSEDPTVFHIIPKTGHDANRTMARYAAASKDGRKGYRELNVSKLDNADIEEFLDTVVKVENFIFSDNWDDEEAGKLIKSIDDPIRLKKVCMDLPSDILIEIFDASNNLSQLKAGEKKTLNSQLTSHSGEAKKGKG